mgnify:CR=1 FL=1
MDSWPHHTWSLQEQMRQTEQWMMEDEIKTKTGIKPMKQLTREPLQCISLTEGPLDEVLSALKEEFADIKRKYPKATNLQLVEQDADCYTVVGTLTEYDEDYANRLAKEYKALENAGITQGEIRNNEFNEYLRLKAKFDPKP